MVAVNALFSKKNLKILAIVLMPIFALGALCGYSFMKYGKVSSQYKGVLAQYDTLTKSEKDLRVKIAQFEETLAQKERALKAGNDDRANLLSQLNSLSGERGRANDLNNQAQELKKQLEEKDKQVQEISTDALELKEKINILQTTQKQLINEKEQLAHTLETERAKAFTAKLQQDKLSLQKESVDLTAKIKQYQADYVQLKESSTKLKSEMEKTKTENAGLVKENTSLNQSLNAALRKNQQLDKRVADMPPKMAELAHQNKVLIRQTSNMHYNMGVYFSKQKEYSRAMAEFEKAVELTPDDAYSQFNLGYIYAEHLINRDKAVEHFRQYLRLANKDDKDVDWVKRYILTWEGFGGKKPMD